MTAELADDADFRFFVVLRPAEDELLLGGKFVPGEDARAVKAEDDSPGALRENFAAQIIADEEDGKFLRDASAAAHNLLRQLAGQRAERAGPI